MGRILGGGGGGEVEQHYYIQRTIFLSVSKSKINQISNRAAIKMQFLKHGFCHFILGIQQKLSYYLRIHLPI